MEYKWSKKEVLKRLREAITTNDYNNIENYRIMLDILNNRVDIHNMDMVKKDDNLTYAEQKDYFIDSINYIDAGIVDYISSIFSIEKDYDSLYTAFLYDSLDLTDEELMSLGHDIINSLKDPVAIKLYEEFMNKRKHRMHMATISTDKKGISKDLEGLTLYDYTNKKTFISIHRNNTAEDITTLIHEFMHALMAHDNEYDAMKYGYFVELEGHFGERLAIDYMNNHGMKKEAITIEGVNIYNILNNAFMVYLSDVLFSTSRDSHYRVRKATEVAREETGYKDLLIRRKDVPYICSYGAFDTITNIIDYLIILELSKKYDLDEQYRMMLELKRQEDYLFYNMVVPDMFDFYKNDCKDFKKLKKSIDKKIRVV